MRILVANTHFSPISFGGATIVAEETSTHLARQGHEVIVLTSLPERLLTYGEMRRYEAHGLAVIAIGRTTPETADAEYHQPALAGRLEQVLRSIQPDVVHFHAVQGLGVEMVRAASTMGVPTVITLHDAWWLCERQFMVRATGEWCGQQSIDPRVCATCVADSRQHRARQNESLQILNGCQRVLTPSDYWRETMAGSGVARDVLQTNHNGVRHPAHGHTRSDARGGPVTFGYVGGGDPVKGALQLRAALQDLGAGAYRIRLVDAGQALGFHGMSAATWDYPGVQIEPAYTSAGIDAFFDSIDVLLFPSQTSESYGLTVREAVLRGVWVVATHGGGTAEVLAEGINATLIPMDGSHLALADAMREIVRSPEDYRCRAHPVTTIPTFAQQAAELASIYAQVSSAPAPAVPTPRSPLAYSSSPE